MMRLIFAFMLMVAPPALAVDWLQLPFGKAEETTSATVVGDGAASDG